MARPPLGWEKRCVAVKKWDQFQWGKAIEAMINAVDSSGNDDALAMYNKLKAAENHDWTTKGDFRLLKKSLRSFLERSFLNGMLAAAGPIFHCVRPMGPPFLLLNDFGVHWFSVVVFVFLIARVSCKHKHKHTLHVQYNSLRFA